MKLIETIKALVDKLKEYTKAAKDIEKKIAETLNGKDEEEEEDDEEEEVVEAPKPKAKKKPAKKKKKHESK